MDDDEELKKECFGGEYTGEVYDHMLKRYYSTHRLYSAPWSNGITPPTVYIQRHGQMVLLHPPSIFSAMLKRYYPTPLIPGDML